MIINFLMFVKLIFAHFLADFCLQPEKVVRKKREGKQLYLLIHALIHATLAYLLAGDWSMWYIPLTIGLSHYLIDLWKYSREESLASFMIDQLMHLTVIVLLWLLATGQTGTVWEAAKTLFANQTIWIYLTGFIFILKPTSVILNVSTKKWEEGRGMEGLKNAGQWIGYLERTLILIFMCLSIYEAIGFILAAKSIYRFGELKEASDIRKTEYIMIGTFLSFTIAVVDGLLIKAFI